jgi:hypothetical protein
MPKGYPYHLDGPLRYVPPPKPETDVKSDDPEGEDWFKRLPVAAQRECRDAWAAGEARDARRLHLAKSTRSRSMIQATLVLLFTETCCSIPSWGHTLATVPAGLVLGFVWHRIGAGRFRCVTTSVVPFAALRLAFVGDASGVGLAAYCIFSVLGFLMLAGLTAAVGYARERRVADDLDH